MADPTDEDFEGFDDISDQIIGKNSDEMTIEERRFLVSELVNDPAIKHEIVKQFLWRWADFHFYITSPAIEEIIPAIVIAPEPLDEDENEFEHVYNIYDAGFKLSTSKASEMFSSGMSMYKLYNTIEKMMYLLTERLRTGGYDDGTEVKVSFEGNELAMRKAFEVLINFPQNLNVIVTNFDPGEWGEPFLQMVRRMTEKGYGPLEEAPRDKYRKKPYARREKPTQSR